MTLIPRGDNIVWLK